jgi:N-acyl homoserine lactone hydrolase
VHLPKTGYVVLSGDVDKVAKILAEKHAQLWINHDKPSSDARRHAPQFYE